MDVRAQNSPPILVQPIPDVTITSDVAEYQIGPISDYFSDPDGDPLSYFTSAIGDPVALAQVTGGILELVVSGALGTATIRVTASDFLSGDTFDTFDVNVVTDTGNPHIVIVTTTSDAVNGNTSSITDLQIDDGGDGISLREAILAANATPNDVDPDEIHFDIPGTGPHTIQPLSALPHVTDPAVVDGYTQPGATPNTNGPDQGTNAVLMIELDGSQAGASHGLAMTSGSSVRGLVINRFDEYERYGISGGAITIEGNFIGTDVTGTIALGNYKAAFVGGGILGGTSPMARNIISGNTYMGLIVQSNSIIQGNLIGIDASGTVALGNGSLDLGMYFHNSSNCLVGGTVPGARNIISGHNHGGISFGGGSNNKFQGNYIGTDVTGTVSLGNATGIMTSGGSDNLIGGTEPGAGNLISGNGKGIAVGGDGGWAVQGNLIGTDAFGTSALGNTHIGIQTVGPNHTIGGIEPGAANVISGNGYPGGSGIGAYYSGHIILGNLIGTDITGKVAIPNGTGIMSFGSSTIIGGTVPGARNIISGNKGGVFFYGPGGNSSIAQGNYIGTDITGLAALPNERYGIGISRSHDNLIGGTVPGAGNVISGNGEDGIRIISVESTGNTIRGNLIGPDKDGNPGIGNGQHGIALLNLANGNLIGGTDPGTGNVIAFNAMDGINTASPTASGAGNSFLGNRIFSNGELAIDHPGDGVTPNDAGDTDAGPNDLQNFPVLTLARSSSVETAIDATLDSQPNSTYRVEFFSNSVADPSGYGEGEFYLGYVDVTTDATGLASFTASLPPTTDPYLSATATSANGSTSEFSNALMPILNSPPALGPITGPVDPVQADTRVDLSAAFDDPDPSDVHEAVWNWGDGTSCTASTEPACSVDQTNDVAIGSHVYEAAGVYPVSLTVTDSFDESDQAVFEFVVVYDPAAGFVTGAGTFDSPAGAYIAAPDRAGKATFGFVSKYQKGATTPSGNTRFRFKMADLVFQSSSYDWLVVANHKAMYKGVGTINNAGNFGFQISAIDEVLTPSTNDDLFRIRIWDRDNGDALVYDNQVGETVDSADPTTAIGGGNIKIQSGGSGASKGGPAAEAVPERFALSQNYPNPFNPSTTISFDVPESSVVRLSVFDMLGKEVSTLVDGTVEPGTHRVVFDAGTLPNGAYVYRLHTPRRTFTRPMVLLK